MQVAYLNAFKQIFKNKSATACLIGIIVRVASLSWTVYYLTFFRVELGFDIQLAALIAFGVILVMTLGRLISGYLIPKVGRKRLPLITMVIEGATLPLIAFVPELWIALVILFSISFIGAFTDHSLANLSLEQVPESRGTMMSLHFAVVWLGATIGAGIGGFVLYLGFGFTGIFLVFSAITFVAVSIFFFFVKDPCVIMAPESTKSKSS
ncbi:MAG: MFS transporter [Candidatus Bathyarchaeota archaeon]